MNIHVTVDGLDAIDLSTVIGDEIAYYNPETEETEHRPRTLGDLVAQKLADKMWAECDRYDIAKQARARRDEVIREKVEPIIEQALTGSIRLTNSYGEPAGPETTLNALIVEEAKKVVAGSRSDYGRGDTLAQRIVKDAVGAAFIKELGSVVAEEKAKVIAAVRAKAADLIADAVKQGVGR